MVNREKYQRIIKHVKEAISISQSPYVMNRDHAAYKLGSIYRSLLVKRIQFSGRQFRSKERRGFKPVLRARSLTFNFYVPQTYFRSAQVSSTSSVKYYSQTCINTNTLMKKKTLLQFEARTQENHQQDHDQPDHMNRQPPIIMQYISNCNTFGLKHKLSSSVTMRPVYSRTSVPRTSLGLWKFVLDMCISNS